MINDVLTAKPCNHSFKSHRLYRLKIFEEQSHESESQRCSNQNMRGPTTHTHDKHIDFRKKVKTQIRLSKLHTFSKIFTKNTRITSQDAEENESTIQNNKY